MSASTQIERSFLSEPPSTRSARAFVAEEFARLGAASATIGKFDLIVSELMANAIQYGDGGEIVVLVDITSPSWLAITVCSGLDGRRPPMDPATWTGAATDQPSGRGLSIVAQLSGEVLVDDDAGRLRVTCRLRR